MNRVSLIRGTSMILTRQLSMDEERHSQRRSRMMSTTEYLSQSVKQCIDDHLDAIDDTLRNSGLSQSERQSILDDVEAQIHDMLIDRAQGEPTVEDARAV